MRREPVRSVVAFVRSVLSWARWRWRRRQAFDPVPLRALPLAAATSQVRYGERRHRPPSRVVVVKAPGTSMARGAAGAMRRHLTRTGADIVYCDHLAGDPPRPLHKPSWSPELLRSGPYFGPAFAVHRSLFELAAGRSTTLHELMLRCAEEARSVESIPSVWARSSGSVFGCGPDPHAAEDSLRRRGLDARAEADPGMPWNRITLTPRQRTPVTIVVPTRDRGDLVDRLVERIETSAAYPFRLLIVDNGTKDESSLAVLDALRSSRRATILAAPGEFNFSRLCNLALASTTSPIVAFLNDDVLPVESGWLAQLVANLDDPDIGAVGTLLYFPNGRIQHAGVIVGLGGAAGNAFRWAGSSRVYFALATARREVSAISGACLVARTADIEALGGFNESLPRDFQDVDLCLRLDARSGLRTVIDPRLPLVHEESATRRHRPADPHDASLFRALWPGPVARDRYYSSRLGLAGAGYELEELHPASAPES
jgi:O-antigen biosynthesis protein